MLVVVSIDLLGKSVVPVMFVFISDVVIVVVSIPVVVSVMTFVMFVLVFVSDVDIGVASVVLVVNSGMCIVVVFDVLVVSGVTSFVVVCVIVCVVVSEDGGSAMSAVDVSGVSSVVPTKLVRVD